MDDVMIGQQVQDATKRFVDVLAGVDAAMWTTPPPGGSWNLSEVLEHVTITNGRILSRLEQGLEPIGDTTPNITDDEMPYLFYGGEEPPNLATPSGTWTDLDEGVERFRASADSLVDWAGETPLDLRRHGLVHPVFGLLDGAQWVRFAAVHTWRHRRELQRVRESLGT